MVIVGIALVVCAFVVRSTIIQIKGFGRTIQVTGAAFKPITSDFAIWEGNLQTSAISLSAASAKLGRDVEAVKAFMASAGFKEGEFEIGPVQVYRSYDREGQPTAYNLSQQVRTQAPDVARITQLSTAASALIQQGVELTSQPPRYVYTKLEDVKIEMIKAATENAKLRAQQLAETAGQEVGAPTSARVGVFQIRPIHSQEVSDYGINDVSSIEKEIVCTVNISFLVE
jgi:hypothetical protein